MRSGRKRWCAGLTCMPAYLKYSVRELRRIPGPQGRTLPDPSTRPHPHALRLRSREAFGKHNFSAWGPSHHYYKRDLLHVPHPKLFKEQDVHATVGLVGDDQARHDLPRVDTDCATVSHQRHVQKRASTSLCLPALTVGLLVSRHPSHDS